MPGSKDISWFQVSVLSGLQLTFNVSNALVEDLLEGLGVLELLLDLANDGLSKLTLLALLDLALVADPRVKNLLGLGSKSGALLELVGLGLELGGFLYQMLAVMSPRFHLERGPLKKAVAV